MRAYCLSLTVATVPKVILPHGLHALAQDVAPFSKVIRPLHLLRAGCWVPA
jgi:hypothetical protein